jgi:hypothetical protein
MYRRGPCERQSPSAKKAQQGSYRWRHGIGRLINRLKQARRIATRYEKRADNYLAMIHIGMILLWLKPFADIAYGLLRTKSAFPGQEVIAPDIENSAGEVKEAKVGEAGLVAAQGDTDQILHPGEDVLHPVAQMIGFLVEVGLVWLVLPGQDHRPDMAPTQAGTGGRAAVAFVSSPSFRIRPRKMS